MLFISATNFPKLKLRKNKENLKFEILYSWDYAEHKPILYFDTTIRLFKDFSCWTHKMNGNKYTQHTHESNKSHIFVLFAQPNPSYSFIFQNRLINFSLLRFKYLLNGLFLFPFCFFLFFVFYLSVSYSISNVGFKTPLEIQNSRLILLPFRIRRKQKIILFYFFSRMKIALSLQINDTTKHITITYAERSRGKKVEDTGKRMGSPYTFASVNRNTNNWFTFRFVFRSPPRPLLTKSPVLTEHFVYLCCI